MFLSAVACTEGGSFDPGRHATPHLPGECGPAFHRCERPGVPGVGGQMGIFVRQASVGRLHGANPPAIGDLDPGATVLDLGAGRRSAYAGYIEPGSGVRLVAVDISPEELAANTDVSETRVADVSKDLPFDDGSVDLVLSRALLEHVDGVPQAVRNMQRVLKPGGQAIHLVPCRYSLFGTAARALPLGPSLTLLHTLTRTPRERSSFRPSTTTVTRAHCGRCSGRPDSGSRPDHLLGTARLFEFFLPVFLLTSLYERFVERRVVEDAASYVVVTRGLSHDAGESIPRCRTSDRGRSGPMDQPRRGSSLSGASTRPGRWSS